MPGDQGPGGGVGTPRSSTFSASVRQTVVPAAPSSDASGSAASLPLSGERERALHEVSEGSSPDTDTDLDLFNASDADAPSSDEGRRRRRRQEEQRTKSLKRLGGKGKEKRQPPPLRTSGLGFGGPGQKRSKPAQAVVVLKEEKVGEHLPSESRPTYCSGYHVPRLPQVHLPAVRLAAKHNDYCSSAYPILGWTAPSHGITWKACTLPQAFAPQFSPTLTSFAG